MVPSITTKLNWISKCDKRCVIRTHKIKRRRKKKENRNPFLASSNSLQIKIGTYITIVRV